MLARLHSLWRVLTARQSFEDRMAEELQFHIEEFTQHLIQSGLSPSEAARRARLEFGTVNTIQEECRQSRGLRLFDELTREFRQAFRLLRKTPGFTVTSLLTLAICLGANLIIFAVIDAVLIRPLPFPDPAAIVSIFNTYPKAGVIRDGSSITNYYERRNQIPALASISIYRQDSAIVGQPVSTMRQPVTRVSPEFFATLGLSPAMGRSFTHLETGFVADRVVIVSDTYWRQQLNRTPNAIGRQIRVDAIPHTIVGILPAGFRFLSSEAQLFFPLSSRPEARGPNQRHSGGNQIQMIARLNNGATLAQAQSQIDSQNATLGSGDPESRLMEEAGFRSIVLSLHSDHVATIRPTLLLMQAGAIALLLIASLNLLNLFLIRASFRAKEMAIRQALGATKLHVVRETLFETTLLTLFGGILGLGLGAVGIQTLATLGAERIPLGALVGFDARLAATAFLASIFLGLVLALPIAWFNLNAHAAKAMQAQTRGGTAGRTAQNLRQSFIVAQIALSIILLSTAGLLGLSLQKTQSISPGFQADQVLTGQISLPLASYGRPQSRLNFNTALLEAINRQPGVHSAGFASNIPLSGLTGKSSVAIPGNKLPPRGSYAFAVDGDYFTAMAFTLRQGRFLDAADSRRTNRVCVVDQDFARHYWPNRSPLGQTLFEGSSLGTKEEAITVVGVVGSARQSSLADLTPQGAVYYPYSLQPRNSLFIAARTRLSPEAFALTLQKLVRQVDPELPVSDIRTMTARVDDSLLPSRSSTFLALFFSAVALALTAVGTYGVLSYTVSQRRHEIGIRIALGARPSQIRAQFLRLSASLLFPGTIIGLAGAWFADQSIQSLLVSDPFLHWPALFAATGIVSLVSLLACSIPSQQAAVISPLKAMGEP